MRQKKWLCNALTWLMISCSVVTPISAKERNSYVTQLQVSAEEDIMQVDSSEIQYSGNPFITSIFTADPSAHVWKDGKLYIYASHDMDPARGCDLMDRYHVFSTEDMVTWQDEGEILSSDDVSWGREEGGFMWAPDCAYKNGTYYFYYPHPSGTEWNNTWKIGVATSNKPASDFTDTGHYMEGLGGYALIDPCVFTDDDGQSYMYIGGGNQVVGGKLADDMISIEGTMTTMKGLEDFHEAIWVFKRNGIYYCMYADNLNGANRLRYATSDNPLGPWNYKGIVLDSVSSYTSHGSIVEFKGEWYLFYHNQAISNQGELRSICVDKVEFTADGSIKQVVQTTTGVPAVAEAPQESQYSTKYYADSFITSGSASKGTDSNAEKGSYIGNLHMSDASITLANVDGGTKGGRANIKVHYASNDALSKVRLEVNDKDWSLINLLTTKGWSNFKGTGNLTVELKPGKNNVIKLFGGKGGTNIDYIQVTLLDEAEEQTNGRVAIDLGTTNGIVEAEDAYEIFDTKAEPCSEGGQNMGYMTDKSYMKYYVNVPKTGTYQLTFRVASLGDVSRSNELQLFSENTLLARADIVTATGGWQTWTDITTTCELKAGKQELRFVSGGPNFNLNYMKFKEISSGGNQENEWVCGIDFSKNTIQANGVELVLDTNPVSEAYTYQTQLGSSYARVVPSTKYAYFKVNSEIVKDSDKDIFVEITYHSNKDKTAQFQYNTFYNGQLASNYKNAPFTVYGSGEWETAVLCLSDVNFRKAQNNGADFRIAGDLSIRSIRLKKKAINPDQEPIGVRTNGSSYSEFIGKTCTGYQAWFGTGEKNERWSHWEGGKVEADGTNWPRANNISFDVYPDVSEYQESSLAETGFANLGNGKKAKLFDSKKADVINTHFKWMKDYGIDGAAVQRFVGGLSGRSIAQKSNAETLVKIKNAAEANERIFYVMYDISGGNEATYVEDIKFDWVYNVEQSFDLLKSPSYATVNGKPVVCIWGLGVEERPSDVRKYQEIIDFFRARDCYIILGTSESWRQQSQYSSIFKQCDMISPWYVGRFGDNNGCDSIYRNLLQPDLSYCKQNNLAYYPVVWSGFSWGLWLNGAPNAIPRRQGEFFWHQAYNLKNLGLDAFYIAMFDEYDEGTAIMKNASDYFDIPTNQYFVTASADGYWLSSDYQLRVAGAAIDMVKGKRAVTEHVPVEHSNGPIYYRNSFESRYALCKDASKSGTYPIDPCFKNPETITSSEVSNALTVISESNQAKTGNYLVATSGTVANAKAKYSYKIADTKITVKEDMVLSFDMMPVNELGKYVEINLLFSDGTYLRDIGTLNRARGGIMKWSNYEYQISADKFNVKVITGIVIEYTGNASGEFKTYFDNITIQRGTAQTVEPDLPN